MVSRLVPRNTVQSVDVESVKIGRVTNSDTGLYTVPTGKVALVTSITGVYDSVGADATNAIAIKRGSTFTPVGSFGIIRSKSEYNGRMLLAAADIITSIGDNAGTNATVDMSASVKEFDA